MKELISVLNNGQGTNPESCMFFKLYYGGGEGWGKVCLDMGLLPG